MEGGAGRRGRAGPATKAPCEEQDRSLQERYAARSTCFGCGPANAGGLRIRSFPRERGWKGAEPPAREEAAVPPEVDVVMRFRARPEHEAFPGYLNGGIAGTLVDCHANWAGVHALMRRSGLDKAPCTVTAEYSIRFLRPIPTADEIEVIARPIDVKDDRVTVEATIVAGGEDCATARGTFVVVKEGHPAFHRW
ncbi:MAG: PaaI family thioesterase [Chloroflexi bacterium]|nr:PaaI family thioesterase [Chloroflexota bacterium]MBI2983290.1 PaaI family thioesterase [Chloroflexota bacterium]